MISNNVINLNCLLGAININFIKQKKYAIKKAMAGPLEPPLRPNIIPINTNNKLKRIFLLFNKKIEDKSEKV